MGRARGRVRGEQVSSLNAYFTTHLSYTLDRHIATLYIRTRGQPYCSLVPSDHLMLSKPIMAEKGTLALVADAATAPPRRRNGSSGSSHERGHACLRSSASSRIVLSREGRRRELSATSSLVRASSKRADLGCLAGVVGDMEGVVGDMEGLFARRRERRRRQI